MFVKNTSSFRPVLRRADVSDDLLVGTVIVRGEYRLSASGLVPWEGVRPGLETDVPTTSEHAIWDGTSVTVAGTVHGPTRPPHLVRVDLQVGDELRTVLVFGERRWVRNAGKLVVSTPAPFETAPLSWALAFGGAYEIPAGPDPIRGLPHPGGQVPYPLNPGGMGFYRDAAVAEGRPLPRIERRETLIRTPEDQPRPAGLAPCPELTGLRLPSSAPAEGDDAEWHLRTMLRAIHPAPGELIFESLAPATPVRVGGVGPAVLDFPLPRSPVRVSTQRGKTSEEVGFRIRAVHVSVDDGAVIIEYAHAFGHAQSAAPAWVRVGDA